MGAGCLGGGAKLHEPILHVAFEYIMMQGMSWKSLLKRMPKVSVTAVTLAAIAVEYQHSMNYALF